MRTKKILSLILAIAMMATISVSAAQSEVYIYEDFDYDSMDDFFKAYGWLDAEGAKTDYYGYSIRNKTYDKAFFTGFRDAGIDKMFMYDHLNYGAFASKGTTYWSIAPNSNGDSTYLNVATANANSWSEKLHFIPTKTWNGVANADEAYVVSYDIEFAGHRFTEETFTGTYTKNSSNKYATSPNVSSFIINYSPVVIYKENASEAFSSASLNNMGYNYKITYTPDPDAELADGIIEAGTYEFTLTGMNVEDGWSGAYGNDYFVNIGDGVVHNFTSVITKASDTSLQRRMYHDGVAYNNNKATTKNLDANYTIHGVSFETGSWTSEKRTNLKAYTLKTTEGAFNVSTPSDVIPVSTTSVKVKFSQPVNTVTYDKTAVTMTAGGEALEYGTDFTVSDLTEVIENEGGEIYAEATVSFMSDLAEDTEYVITFPGTIKNTAYIDLAGYNTVNFSTPKPEIAIGAFNVIKGFGSASEVVAENFVANGTLQGAKLNLTNTTDAPKNVAVVYAVYSSAGQLTDIVYINDTLEANTTDNFHAGVKLAQTGSVKAFIWDGLNSLKPHSDAIVRTISAE